MRGRARPDDEPVQPVKLDGWSMAYQLTSLGAEVDTLDSDAAANAVDDRVGALEARAAEIMALRDVGVTPDAYLVALDYLLAMMQTELSWLREFAGSLRSGQLECRQAVSDSKVRSHDEVGI
jgi:hypothetical protein